MPRPAAVYGIDIGKNIFHVVGLSCDGTPVQKVRFRRGTLLQFFARVAPSIVGMESCAGSQWLARKIQALGHKVRLIPAQFVEPYVKSNKNDIIDAEAIAEATTRPTMRFVTVKETDQVDLQALHRIRDQMIGSRTRLINQMRATGNAPAAGRFIRRSPEPRRAYPPSHERDCGDRRSRGRRTPTDDDPWDRRIGRDCIARRYRQRTAVP
ncbi:transposase [Sinorhizobium kostiense]|uniref:Transposase n=1 Tax=Sinorhizobium kostiense TaxID=76747 RepID=A0ABS4R1F1_9HYPH|nr:transposase [Sinorhizobium kostiense]